MISNQYRPCRRWEPAEKGPAKTSAAAKSRSLYDPKMCAGRSTTADTLSPEVGVGEIKFIEKIGETEKDQGRLSKF